MVDVNAHVLGSIINVNKANSAVKVQREPDWTKQNKKYLHVIFLKCKNIENMKVKKYIYQANT